MLVLLALPALSQPSVDKRIAVLEFRGKAVSDEVKGTLADEARAGVLEATRGRGYLVMTQESMAAMLKDMGRANCAEGECEVETARNIGADYVVSGGLVLIDAELHLSLKLHEASTGRLLATNKVDGAKSSEVFKKVADAAKQLVADGLGARGGKPLVESRIGGDSPDFSVGADAALIEFSSEPVGATVAVDGELLCKETPCRKSVEAGSHQVVMQKERYVSATSTFVARRGAVVRVTLEPRFGWLVVDSAPPGLRLQVDGQAQVAGAGAIEIEPGLHEVLIDDACWVREGEKVKVARGERRALTLQGHARQAAVKVTAEDERGNEVEARVTVDGREVGMTPGTFKVPVCSKRIEAALPKGAVASAELSLQEKQLSVVRLVAVVPAQPEPTPSPAENLPTAEQLARDAVDDQKADGYIDSLKKIMPKLEDGNPQKADVLFQLSEIYWEKSRRLARKELAAAGSEKKADHRQSELYRAEVMRLYETVLREYPSYERKDEVLFDLAYNLYQTGKVDQAVNRYTELLKASPGSKFAADVYVQLGNHFFENAKDFPRAQTNYEHAFASTNPRIKSYALYRLAWCDFKLGDSERALKKFQDVVDFCEKQSQGKSFVDLKREALHDLVWVYAKLGFVDDARAYLKAHAASAQVEGLIQQLDEATRAPRGR